MRNARLPICLVVLLISAYAASQQPKSVSPNDVTARHFFERANAKDIPGMLSDLAADAKNFGRSVGPDGYRRNFEDLFTTFPDWRFEVIDTLAKGDDVVIRCKVSATHKGKGRLGFEPTGKHFEIEQMHWFKFRDGKIVDHYAERDDMGMFDQLGLLTLGPTAKK